jgi:hypothetical protein
MLLELATLVLDVDDVLEVEVVDVLVIVVLLLLLDAEEDDDAEEAADEDAVDIAVAPLEVLTLADETTAEVEEFVLVAVELDEVDDGLIWYTLSLFDPPHISALLPAQPNVQPLAGIP